MELSLPFTKAHGLGNDFLLVRAEEIAQVDRQELARRICDRYTGVGADGLVVLGDSDHADASFRIYNSDGSEAGLSGNALRCAAAWLLQREKRDKIRLDTKVGPRDVFFVEERQGTFILRAEIGVPSFSAEGVPFRPLSTAKEPIVDYPLPVGDVTVPVTVLWMGNPQCIVMRDETQEWDWKSLGADIERHPYFPDRANVGFVRVLGENRVEARFWERGAGHTLASGTGSCACAVAAHLSGRTGRQVTVEVELGRMEVSWRPDGMVELTGPAEVTAEGRFHRAAASSNAQRRSQ